MTVDRLENLRVIDGLLTVYQMRLDALPDIPPYKIQREVIKVAMASQIKERDAVYDWIEAIPKTTIANAIILRYVKQATWQEIGEYTGGISGNTIKKMCLRYIWTSDGGLHDTKRNPLLEDDGPENAFEDSALQ